MAVTFTKEQLSAINTQDKTLLVSAGAGAGKTATLTERIIRQLLNDEKPMDISRMLIVTFTKAAAGELRERIGKALRQAVIENPKNRHIEAQLHLLQSAKISTIDSFCNDIFKNNAESFGISPKYRILDPTEGAILSRNLLTGLIGAIYDLEADNICTPEELSRLSDSLSGVKTELNLEDVLLKLYRDSQSLEGGVEVFAKYRDSMKSHANSPLASPHVAHVIASAKNTISLYRDVYNSLIPELEREGEFVKEVKEKNEESNNSVSKKKDSSVIHEKFLDKIKEDLSLFDAINDEEDYEAIRMLITEKMPTSPIVKEADETVLILKVKEFRKEVREAVAELAKKFFKWEKDEWSEAYITLAKSIDTLYRVLKEFDRLFFEEKKSRASLEYSDIENLAYKTLYNEDGALTDFALAEKEQYDAVYIDEYQDVNELQNKIFEAVSSDRNRFMVGDIKQSIYGFRGASPEIFRRLKGEFPYLSSATAEDSAATVFMSQNFRCDRGIINFVNTVFDRAFSIASESIGYVAEDKLDFAKYKKEEEPKLHKPVMKIFTGEDLINEGLADEKTESEDREYSTDPDEYDDPTSSAEISAIYVAKKIKQLLAEGTLASGKAIEPSDIAILLRNDSGKAEIYKKALTEYGISTSIGNDKTFFENADVELMLCLLNSIDNPTKDIYLAGLLLSPLYSFTADELVLIRKRAPASSLWRSLKIFSENNESFVKGRSFINTINKYRALSEGMPTDALILRLYSETGLYALAMRTGGKENLMRLYNYAREFEGTSYKGLYNFISYVNTAIMRGASFSEKKSEAQSASVKICTMHSSKGLEYPVVFICEAGGALTSTQDSRQPFRMCSEFGFALNPKSERVNSLIESPIFNAIDDAMRKKSLYEELRVIYVAFTRAREYLYIVGKSRKKTRGALDATLDILKRSSSPSALMSLRSIIDLVLYCAEDTYLEDNSPFSTKPDGQNAEVPSLPSADTQKEDGEAENEKESDKDSLSSLILNRLTYEYPNAHLTTLPEKMSISRLHPRVLDGTDETVKDIDTDNDETTKEEPKRIRPEFFEANKLEESKKRGIATHTFMQFCDIENLYKNGAENELSRLFDNGFLTKEDKERVRLSEIEAFRQGSLLTEMRNAKSIYREFRFNTNLPAYLFTEEKKELYKESEVLLQGVIDCIFEDEMGEYHLVDYKTDRLTREELSDRALAEKKLRDSHTTQLTYYSLAIEKIFGKAPKTLRVYSLALGDCIDIEKP